MFNSASKLFFCSFGKFGCQLRCRTGHFLVQCSFAINPGQTRTMPVLDFAIWYNSIVSKLVQKQLKAEISFFEVIFVFYSEFEILGQKRKIWIDSQRSNKKSKESWNFLETLIIQLHFWFQSKRFRKTYCRNAVEKISENLEHKI